MMRSLLAPVTSDPYNGGGRTRAHGVMMAVRDALAQ
jgi:hypothetical protein